MALLKPKHSPRFSVLLSAEYPIRLWKMADVKREGSMQNLRIQLRAVFYKEGEVWVAHCLEMDVMGHGKTKTKALHSLNDAITLQLANSLNHDNRANIFMPADARFFEMYMAGKDVVVGDVQIHEIPKPTERSKDRQQVPRFQVEELQTREACFA